MKTENYYKIAEKIVEYNNIKEIFSTIKEELGLIQENKDLKEKIYNLDYRYYLKTVSGGEIPLIENEVGILLNQVIKRFEKKLNEIENEIDKLIT